MLGFKVKKANNLLKRLSKSVDDEQAEIEESVKVSKKRLITPNSKTIPITTTTTKKNSNQLITNYFPTLKNLPALPLTTKDGNEEYKKYRHLLKSSSVSIKHLPERYQRLFRIFKAMDSTLAFHYARSSETQLIFCKVKSAIENSAETGVSEKHIAQVVHVDTGMFDIQPSRITFNSTLVYTFRFGWINVPDNIQLCLKQRQDSFAMSLIQSAQAHHVLYVKENGLNHEGVDEFYSGFMEFGPEFETDSRVLDACIKPSSTERARETIEIFRKEEPKNDSVDISSKLSLLERIRMKDQKRKEREASNSKKASLKELAMISQLPKIVSILDATYRSEKKDVFYLSQAVKFVMEGMKTPISEDECRKSLERLREVIPEWIDIKTSEFGVLVKLPGSIERAAVMQKLKVYLDSLK